MPKEFHRRIENYNLAIENKDRPIWTEEQKRKMKTNWQNNTKKFADLEDFVTSLLVENDIVGPIRSVYHSFAKKIYAGFLKKKLSLKAIRETAEYWSRVYGADKRILNKIINYVVKTGSK